MNNLDLWNKVKQPPETVLKKIAGGRLAGKTDISPQWRFQALTEQFGMCGIGWKYVVEKKWSEQGTAGQVFAFADISLYVKVGDTWSDPIPGSGGSMLIEQEKNGLHCNDEAYKMAVTDAISVAAKQLGFAADIYLGLWDGSKYRDVQPLPDPMDQRQPADQRSALPQPAQAQQTNGNAPSSPSRPRPIRSRGTQAIPPRTATPDLSALPVGVTPPDNDLPWDPKEPMNPDGFKAPPLPQINLSAKKPTDLIGQPEFDQIVGWMHKKRIGKSKLLPYIRSEFGLLSDGTASTMQLTVAQFNKLIATMIEHPELIDPGFQA